MAVGEKTGIMSSSLTETKGKLFKFRKINV